MVHLRVVVPERHAERAMDLLCGTDSVLNVIRLEERAVRPEGVVIMCDVAGAPADAVVWEEVEARTDEQVELSGAFLLFMVLAALIAAVGIYQDSAILIVGAMVVGPEFGPIAGLCVALVQRRKALAARSARALLIGFPLAILAAYVATLIFRATGIIPDELDQSNHQLANIIASPDFLAFFVAVSAG